MEAIIESMVCLGPRDGPLIHVPAGDQQRRAGPVAEGAAAHLAAIVESSDDAIISKTLDGAIVSWNRAAERLYGYAAGEVIGQSMAILIPPRRARELPRLMKRLKRGERIAPYETMRVHKDGRRIAVAASHWPITDAAGTISGAATITRDLTVQKGQSKPCGAARSAFASYCGAPTRCWGS